MNGEIPEKLRYFLKNGIKDVDDGYEYASELNRILNSDECQTSLSGKQIELLREYADKARKVGEINYYSEQKIKDLEREFFGENGILGYLGETIAPSKPVWPF
ncbi:hypothetical protein [Acetivibrio cellulolyticus]|uniref:hypothetical protein n=1 Tax=Acetivibrio cellulolyticus TaxID=35830 RepID=UPI0001E2FB98|nr:hypothetical protein [Acetivibrio cellulolyticus]